MEHQQSTPPKRTVHLSNPLSTECGTLKAFLAFLRPPLFLPVLMDTLELLSPYGAQYQLLYVVHLSTITRPNSPIIYTTFFAAATVGVGEARRMIFPSLLTEQAERRAKEHRAELAACVKRLVLSHPAVNEIQEDARLYLPDEQIGRRACKEDRIRFQEGHWVLQEEEHRHP